MVRSATMPVLSAIIMIGLSSSHAKVQGQSMEHWIAWGDSAMARGEYYGASRFYDGALAIDGGRMAVQWKQAEACRLSNQYDKAALYYDKVQRKDMGRTYKDALRWLGEMQLCTGGYEAARKTWNRILQKERNKDSVIAQRARNALAGCTIALELESGHPAFALEHLPSPVNSYDSEFGARIGPDSALYFSSLRGELNKDGEVVDTSTYQVRIYRSMEKRTGWDEVDALGTRPDHGATANITWSDGGSRVFVTQCPGAGPCRIHSGPFNALDLVVSPVEGLGDDLSTQPMIARREGRDILFFASDRVGGEGGMDIWQAELRDGQAVDPQPLGPPVNSPGNERSPWFDAGSGTLWFSSDFHPGLGGFDIFTSRSTNGTFAAPTHAGLPINSPANDLYPAIYPARGEGWLTSNRIGSLAAKGETCCNDLYRWRTMRTEGPQVDPVVPDTLVTEAAAVDQLLEASRRFPLQLYFHNDDPDPRSWDTTTAQDYATTYRRYRDLLPDYERQGDAEEIGTFFKDEVDRGYLELAELVIALDDVLAQGTSVTLHVRGHASPLARNDYNRNLSLRRIESLRNHLRSTSEGRLRAHLDGTAANGARLSIDPLPFGEERSRTGVSDDLGDLKRSVYSVDAARERRISIESMELHGGRVMDGREYQGKDLGTLPQGEERRVSFPVRNRGNAPMRIIESKADCGCTTAELPDRAISPGEEVHIVVVFNGRATTGPLRRTVTLRTDGHPATIELTIEGQVVQ